MTKVIAIRITNINKRSCWTRMRSTHRISIRWRSRFMILMRLRWRSSPSLGLGCLLMGNSHSRTASKLISTYSRGNSKSKVNCIGCKVTRITLSKIFFSKRKRKNPLLSIFLNYLIKKISNISQRSKLLRKKKTPKLKNSKEKSKTYKKSLNSWKLK